MMNPHCPVPTEFGRNILIVCGEFASLVWLVYVAPDPVYFYFTHFKIMPVDPNEEKNYVEEIAACVL